MVEENVLSFEPNENGSYQVHFNDVDIGVFHITKELFGIQEQKISDLEQLGELLGKALFSQCNKMSPLFRGLNRSARLVIEFCRGSEGLISLPWEFMKSPESTKPISLKMPFVRRIGKGMDLKPIEQRPLKVLVVICEPLALQQFNARRFHDAISEEAKALVDEGFLQLEFLSLPATPDVLARRMLKDCPDVVHFIGHGNVGILSFEDNGCDVIDVEAERFNVFFQNDNLRLVILTACFSGAIADKDLVSGTATAMVKAGVPAVLAMQLPIEVEAAHRLVGDLYAILLKQPFDQVVKQLRTSRFFADRLHFPCQWGIPVFYLQDKSERLLKGACEGEGFLKCWAPLSLSFELPARPQLFVGRKELLPKINWALVDNRVVVLQGLSGMGKSFLARELCNYLKLRGSFPRGIIWLNMGTKPSYPMVLEKIGLALKVEDFSEESIKNHLEVNPTLIIFDSFESVKADQDIVRFLTNLPEVSRALLTTTDWIGIGRPIRVGKMAEEDAVELFYLRAKQEGWDETQKEHIYDVCKELDFVPLFIELVAPRAASVPISELVKEVRKEICVIAAERPDLPERQRTAIAAMRFSYDPLEPQERLVFSIMSVFHGTVMYELLSRIAEVTEEDTLRILEKLHKKGFVNFDGSRYMLHHMVRRFASDRLKKEFKKKQEYEKRFAGHYLALAKVGVNALKTEDLGAAVNMVQLEIPNFLGVQRWLIEREKFLECTFLAISLDKMLHIGGLWRTRIEVASIGRKAAERLEDETLLAVILNNLGLAYFSTGNLDQAEKLHKESLAIERRTENEDGIAITIHNLGLIEQQRGNLDEAEKHYRESLAMAKKIGDNEKIASTIYQLGLIEQQRGNLDEAEKHYKESLDIAKKIGCIPFTARILQSLGRICDKKGLFDSAVKQFITASFLLNQIGAQQESLLLEDIVRIVEKIGLDTFREILMKEPQEVRNYIKRQFSNI